MAITHILLYVDDDATLVRSCLRMFNGFLTRVGFGDRVQVYTAGGYGEALTLAASLKEERPDAKFMVVTDGNMAQTGGDGDQLIDELQKLLGDRLRERVIVSGNAGQFSARSALVQAHCLGKPFELKDIASLINHFVNDRPTQELPAVVVPGEPAPDGEPSGTP
jgi:hypothetical protein